MRAGEWLQLMTGLGILAAMFAFPVITLWLDARRERRAAAAARQERAYTPD